MTNACLETEGGREGETQKGKGWPGGAVSYKSRGAHQEGPEGTAGTLPRQAAIQALAESFRKGCEGLALAPRVDLKNPEVGCSSLKLNTLQ